MIQKTVKVTNKGMVSIPAALRKKFGIKDGDYVSIYENSDGTIQITPLIPLIELKKDAPSVEEFSEYYQNARQEELDLEH